MPRKKRWEEGRVRNGVVPVTLFSWKYFNDFIYQEMLDYRDYIWRGHRCDDWVLEPSLDRAIASLPQRRRTQSLRRQHLDNFKYAVRGRRGPNPTRLESENDWWALGQHNGLATPLLDWTNSPYAAAYFAFVEEGINQTPRRVVYALSVDGVEEKSNEIASAIPDDGRPPIIEFVRPLADDNPRLVNQSALFSRAPDNMSIESWVEQNFQGEERTWILVKITIPNSDRKLCLRSLNRMNINHLTLFPDLFGASFYCDVDLDIEEY